MDREAFVNAKKIEINPSQNCGYTKIVIEQNYCSKLVTLSVIGNNALFMWPTYVAYIMIKIVISPLRCPSTTR